MSAIQFNQVDVNPGEPLTAQAWNEVTRTIAAILLHIGAAKVQVKVTGFDKGGARVTATRSDGAMFEAVPPVAGSDYTFSALPSGTYTLRAEAPGYDAAQAPLTVSSSSPPPVQTLAPAKRDSVMPSVFGQKLPDALAALSAAAIKVGQIVDVTGRSVPAVNPAAEFTTAFVLMQFPPAGVPVAATQVAQLVISAKLETTAEVPSLVGLTLAQAKDALTAVGLELGTVTEKKGSGSTGGTGGTKLPDPNTGNLGGGNISA